MAQRVPGLTKVPVESTDFCIPLPNSEPFDSFSEVKAGVTELLLMPTAHPSFVCYWAFRQWVVIPLAFSGGGEISSEGKDAVLAHWFDAVSSQGVGASIVEDREIGVFNESDDMITAVGISCSDVAENGECGVLS